MSFCSFIQGRRFLSRRLRRFLPERYPFEVHSKLSLFLDSRDLNGPSFYVAHGGPGAFYFYEEKIKSEILNALPAQGTFFDLGTNIGIHTFFVANFLPQAKIYSFEPGESLQKCLRSAIEKNEFRNVTVVPSAVGDRNGKAVFWEDRDSSGGNSLIRESIGNTAQQAPREVETVTLDSFTEKNQIAQVDVIKIDVQDAEDLVLAGATRLIQKSRPTLIIESQNQKLAQGLGRTFQLPAGYQFREAGDSFFRPLSSLPEFARQRHAQGKIYSDYVLRTLPNS